jgi:RND superfamily putative drug exporter
MRSPVAGAALPLVVLVGVAVPATRIDLGTHDLAARPSGHGAAVLERYFSPGAVGPIQVVVENPHGPLTGTWTWWPG